MLDWIFSAVARPAGVTRTLCLGAYQ